MNGRPKTNQWESQKLWPSGCHMWMWFEKRIPNGTACQLKTTSLDCTFGQSIFSALYLHCLLCMTNIIISVGTRRMFFWAKDYTTCSCCCLLPSPSLLVCNSVWSPLLVSSNKITLHTSVPCWQSPDYLPSPVKKIEQKVKPSTGYIFEKNNIYLFFSKLYMCTIHCTVPVWEAFLFLLLEFLYFPSPSHQANSVSFLPVHSVFHAESLNTNVHKNPF